MLRPPIRGRVTAPSADEVWMLAFGSNMASQTLTQRRGVVPRRSLPAVAPGSALSFGMLGMPFAEPAFAVLRRRRQGMINDVNSAQAWWPVLEAEMRQRRRAAAAAAAGAARAPAAPMPPPTAHGVLHLISRDDWRRVLASEGVVGASGYEVGQELEEEEEEEAGAGGNGGGGGGRGYRIARVRCRAYNPCARVAPPAFSSGEQDADADNDDLSRLPLVEAVTLGGASAQSQHGGRRRALPSRRYLSLLRSGAKEHGLSPRYRAWLDALACYDPNPATSGPGLLLVGAAAAAAAAPAAAAAAALGALGGSRGKGAPPSSLAEALSSYANLAQQVAWQAHDLLGGDDGGAIGLAEAEEQEDDARRRRQRRDDGGGGSR